MDNLCRLLQQCFLIPKPRLTEQNLPDQFGRVFLITGGSSGVGCALADILYSKNGIVYITEQSAEKIGVAIQSIQKAHPFSKGKIQSLTLDLGDLSTIKASVEEFLLRENRLDVLVNNAGVMTSAVGSITAQGHELQLGTNCLGHFLLTCQLWPILERTASTSAPGSVRVSWSTSLGVESAPEGGVPFDVFGTPCLHERDSLFNYTISKVGVYFLASQFAQLLGDRASGKGVVSLAFNPGTVQTSLGCQVPSALTWVFDKMIAFPAVFGAYTALWAGWSDDVKPEDHGRYIWPWGRFGEAREDIAAQMQPGGNAELFWDWCLRETKPYL